MRLDNQQVEAACAEAEKKLKSVEKLVQTRVAVLNEIKSNFAYIYDKIRLIKSCEERKKQELQPAQDQA